MHVLKLKMKRSLVLVFIMALSGSRANAQAERNETTQSSSLPELSAAGPAFSDDPTSEAAAATTHDATPESLVEAPTGQVANSKGLEESSLSNDKGHDEFKRPLLFAPDDNGLQPNNPQIKWEMDTAGNKINMGGLRLSSSQVFIKIDQLKRSIAPNDVRASEKGPTTVVNMSFSWPTVLTSSGTVTLESMDHTATWTAIVTEDTRTEWRKKLARYKTRFLKVHQGSQWGITDLPSSALKNFRAGAPFRVCLSKQATQIERLRVCSAPYAFQSVSGGQQVLPVQATHVATVSLKDQPIGKAGLINVPIGKELALRIDFADGTEIEIASQPAALDLLDVVESKDGREIILTGRSNQPLGKKKIIERPATHFWSASGADQDTVWQVALPKDAPTIRILGAFNLPFTFLFRFEKLPTENDRVFIREGASTGTYSSAPVLYGYSPKTGRIESAETWAKKTDEHHFEWDFNAPVSGARNKSRISLLGDEESKSKWVGHHFLYRGYPFEASARVAGVIGSGGQLIVIGELSGSAWFETLGLQNDLLSRQRWGAASRYFRTLTAIQSAAGTSVSDFSAMNFDLKYNVVRGIWNRDQLFGVMGSLERVTIAGLKANLGGVGAYWARTLPKVFADLFDKFSLLDYSKYFDVEFVYYPIAASGDVEAGSSYNLNFHGKVFWTQRLYGEAGFGIHQYAFSNPSQNAKIEFATAYGNIGMGITF